LEIATSKLDYRQTPPWNEMQRPVWTALSYSRKRAEKRLAQKGIAAHCARRFWFGGAAFFVWKQVMRHTATAAAAPPHRIGGRLLCPRRRKGELLNFAPALSFLSTFSLMSSHPRAKRLRTHQPGAAPPCCPSPTSGPRSAAAGDPRAAEPAGPAASGTAMSRSCFLCCFCTGWWRSFSD
jgi:hypothetical protein